MDNKNIKYRFWVVEEECEWEELDGRYVTEFFNLMND